MLPDAFVVVVGANDGQQSDHLAPLLRSSSWRGIMVEPHPEAFKRLSERYGADPRFALENAAIADRDGRLTLYGIVPPESPAEWELVGSYDVLGSLSREALLSHRWISDLERRIVTIEVDGLRFETLCRRHAIERIDLLLVDTEGYDFEILKGVGLDQWRPRLVVYEHALLNAADRGRARRLMEELGYVLMEEHLDTWCLDDSIDDRLTRRWRRLSPAGPAISLRE